jgi:septal ring factor EnvC (AmiA/AmiB activator)
LIGGWRRRNKNIQILPSYGLARVFDNDFKEVYSRSISATDNAMVKKQAKKGVTIDDLALMVQRGFLGVDEKFQGMEQRFDGLAADVAVLKTDVAVLKTDVAELKTDVAELKTDVAELKTNLAVLEVTVNRIDTRTQNQVDAVYEDITHIKAHIGLPAK